MIDGFIDIVKTLIETNPELFLAIVLFFIAYFRQEINYLVQTKLLGRIIDEDETLKQKILDVVSSMKYISCFNEQVITTDSETLCDEMKYAMDQSRKDSRPIVFDLSKIKQINENAKEALRDSIRYAIDEDDINLLIVFPKVNSTHLYNEITRYIKKRGSTCVQIKRDSRQSDRVMIVDENSCIEREPNDEEDT